MSGRRAMIGEFCHSEQKANQSAATSKSIKPALRLSGGLRLHAVWTAVLVLPYRSASVSCSVEASQ